MGKKNKQDQGKKENKKEEKEDFNALLKKLSVGTERKEPQVSVSIEDAKARRKKKAQQLREAKQENMPEDDMMKMLEQQRQQQQLQQILQMLQQSMGRSEILDNPITEKSPLEEKEDKDVEVALCGMQGWRRSMEDAHTAELSIANHKYFAVYDGHAGKQCAEHLSKTLAQRVVDTPEFKSSDYEKAMISAYLAADEDLHSCDEGSGCTAVGCIISPSKEIICANVGDSRAVLSRGGVAVELSSDHKPSLPEEEERIIKAGGSVSMNRVNGQLAMSRAMGDFTYKQNASLKVTEQQVIPLPEVRRMSLCKNDEFLIVACDGVWDVLSSQQAVDFVKEKMNEGMKLKEIVQAVADRCCCPPAPTGGPSQGLGTDNITVIVVVFRDEFRKGMPAESS